MKIRYHVSIQGIVQGVGFRPFVYQQAKAGNLTGYVTNTSQGVELEIEGESEAVENFLQALQNNPPPLSRITGLQVTPLPLAHDPQFSILQSIIQEERSALISPDIATCHGLFKRTQRPDGSPLSVSLYQLHQLWSPLHHYSGHPL